MSTVFELVYNIKEPHDPNVQWNLRSDLHASAAPLPIGPHSSSKHARAPFVNFYMSQGLTLCHPSLKLISRILAAWREWKLISSSIDLRWQPACFFFFKKTAIWDWRRKVSLLNCCSGTSCWTLLCKAEPLTQLATTWPWPGIITVTRNAGGGPLSNVFKLKCKHFQPWVFSKGKTRKCYLYDFIMALYYEISKSEKFFNGSWWHFTALWIISVLLLPGYWRYIPHSGLWQTFVTAL